MNSLRVIDEAAPAPIGLSASVANATDLGLLQRTCAPDKLSGRAAEKTPDLKTNIGTWTRGRGPTIVVYHNLAASEHPLTRGLGVTTDPEVFRRHVRYFAKNFDLIGPSDLLAARLPKKPLLITFDDVYRSVLDIAGPILRDVAASSIWFLNPASIVEEALPIDNLLALAAQCAGASDWMAGFGLHHQAQPPVSTVISRDLPRLTYAEVGRMCASAGKLFGTSEVALRRESSLFLTVRDLPRLASYGIEVGNHSMTHRFLRSLSPPELHVEIADSRRLLEQLSGQTVRYFAVPYGNELDATSRALAIARMSGHEAIFLVHARCNTRRRTDDVFYRIGPESVRPQLLPIVLNVLPRLRTAWKFMH